MEDPVEDPVEVDSDSTSLMQNNNRARGPGPGGQHWTSEEQASLNIYNIYWGTM